MLPIRMETSPLNDLDHNMGLWMALAVDHTARAYAKDQGIDLTMQKLRSLRSLVLLDKDLKRRAYALAVNNTGDQLRFLINVDFPNRTF
jgi:hypothetical protein